jgi:hypothetical protein
MKLPDYIVNFLAGGLSGICEVTITHPLDVIKTNMQYKIAKMTQGTKGDSMIQSSYADITHRYRVQGLAGLYPGYLPRVLGILPMRATFWGVQYTSYEHLKSYDITKNNRILLAGVLGGSAQTLIDNPIEVIKTRIITSNRTNYSKSPSIYYAGFGPTLIRNIGFMVVFNKFSTAYPTDDYRIKFVMSGLGGFVGSIVTQPIDYVKTQMHAASYDTKNHRPAIHIFLSTLSHSPRILMTGAIPRATLGFINMGVGFTVFTFLKDRIHNL